MGSLNTSLSAALATTAALVAAEARSGESQPYHRHGSAAAGEAEGDGAWPRGAQVIGLSERRRGPGCLREGSWRKRVRSAA